MCKWNEEEIARSIEQCSLKSEEELLKELSESNVSHDDFNNFIEMISPLLTQEQLKRARDIQCVVEKE